MNLMHYLCNAEVIQKNPPLCLGVDFTYSVLSTMLQTLQVPQNGL